MEVLEWIIQEVELILPVQLELETSSDTPWPEGPADPGALPRNAATVPHAVGRPARLGKARNREKPPNADTQKLPKNYPKGNFWVIVLAV